MTVRVFEDQGAAEQNKAVVVGRVQSIGPVDVIMSHLGTEGEVVCSLEDQRTGAHISSDKDTAVADEDTGYDGDTSTLTFTGQTLNNLPVVPGTVTVKPTAGGDTVNATDRDGDGILYTSDGDEDVCGSINYFTGALELSYPAGKAPNTGDIDCDYEYQDATLKARGRRNFRVNNVLQEETVVVKAAASNAGGVKIRVDGIATWV